MKNVLAALTVGVLTLSACDQVQAPVEPTEENYAPTGWVAKTLPEIAEGIRTGAVTSEEMVRAYLSRIERIDRSGPTLRSVLAINPNALDDAVAADQARASGAALGPLHGVPILLKDNIESADPIATTAGALALKDNITGRDSPLVAGLRAAGAIILGKTNLSQWANFRSEGSMSGWSALGGQVKNPNILDRNPCGSSSGSGSAGAASLAAGTVGTETNGSVICPSNANGLVGFKPTVGVISQQYIIPISSTQDTAGPMVKTVRGAAMMMDAMQTTGEDMGFTNALDTVSLSGKRIGVLRYAQGSNDRIVEAFEASLKMLEEAGAELIDITEAPEMPDGVGRMSYDILKYEFKATLNEYLASTPETVTTRTLTDLIAFNEDKSDIELVMFNQNIFEASDALAGLDDPSYIAARDTVGAATRAGGIDRLLYDHGVDLLVAPSGAIAGPRDAINGDLWPPFPGAGSMAARAGYPHATVPMAYIRGMPVGLSFIGGHMDDVNVLSAAYIFEQSTKARREPAFLKTAADDPIAADGVKGFLFN